MTLLLWLGIVLGALVVLEIGLRAAGAARWAEMTRTHTTQLESGSIDAHELEGLPPPVQRYFRAVLTDGHRCHRGLARRCGELGQHR
ncbi:MAG TPA: hypothetical protein PKX82_05240 [Rhodoferax sp.]|nr:hypothetical protein [Rhodoferax sp.]